MIVQIIIGILIVALGALMVYKTTWFLQMIGRIYWAEKTFGGGGTRFFLKLIGIGMIFFGLIIATDLFERFFGGFLLSLFRF
ncbi:hypothetical protein KJ766_03920 [Patescibacteria group bacterium]|nr:hypothetical protein [Patescibacteria group bacterium]